MAMETLLTAIAIIKQSRVYEDERCQALVTSLKDCLISIQGNYGHRCAESTTVSPVVTLQTAVSFLSCYHKNPHRSFQE